MKRLINAMLATVFILTLAHPAAADDCGWYEGMIAWALGMKDMYNNSLAYDELFLAQDIANGADQGTINADIDQCRQDAAMAAAYQSFADGWNEALARCY